MKTISLYIALLSSAPNFIICSNMLENMFSYREKSENAETDLSIIGFYDFLEMT